MTQVRATVNGAISIVNAISTWKGATLGIESKVEATIRTSEGRGIFLKSENQNLKELECYIVGCFSCMPQDIQTTLHRHAGSLCGN
jgi:shikimate kinase